MVIMETYVEAFLWHKENRMESPKIEMAEEAESLIVEWLAMADNEIYELKKNLMSGKMEFKAPCNNKKCPKNDNSQSGCSVNGDYTVDMCGSYDPPFSKYIELVRIVGEAKALMESMSRCSAMSASMEDHIVKNTVEAMRDWIEKEEKFFKITLGDDK